MCNVSVHTERGSVVKAMSPAHTTELNLLDYSDKCVTLVSYSQTHGVRPLTKMTEQHSRYNCA